MLHSCTGLVMCTGISLSQEQKLGRHLSGKVSAADFWSTELIDSSYGDYPLSISGDIIGKPSCGYTTLMELKRDLWHAQTPSTTSLSDQPALIRRDRSTSVSRLVAR